MRQPTIAPPAASAYGQDPAGGTVVDITAATTDAARQEALANELTRLGKLVDAAAVRRARTFDQAISAVAADVIVRYNLGH